MSKLGSDDPIDDGVDAQINSPEREGLTGTAPSELYVGRGGDDTTEITTGPDGAPLALQPSWRKDFPIDWPVDQYVARRDFAKFLVLTSGAFVAGQAWIAAQDLIRGRRGGGAGAGEKVPAGRSGFPRSKIAQISNLKVGSALVFRYPTEHERCLLIRTEPDVFLAYSQSCTHLSCAVVPRIDKGVLHCPCHEGYFDLKTGRNIAVGVAVAAKDTERLKTSFKQRIAPVMHDAARHLSSSRRHKRGAQDARRCRFPCALRLCARISE